jgi:pimeloyl-ACP methyl ester carboxylesterase
MRPRLVTLLLGVLLATVRPAAAQWETVETFTLKGAHGVIVVPENWNGGLFVYAHGYSADSRIIEPFPDDLSPSNFTTRINVLYQAAVLPTFLGYAVATTTFRSVGWYVKDAIKDLESLRRRFVRRFGRPTTTYLWGHSGGGMMTATVIERFPDVYDGAMPLCGPVAGARRNFNGAFDLRVIYEYVCRDVPEARFACGLCADGRTRCLEDRDCPAGGACAGRETPAPPEDGLTRECTEFLLANPDRFSESPTSVGGGFVLGPVEACFGDLTGGGTPSADELERRDLFLRASGVPESFVATDMFFATIGMAELVHRRNRGRHPWGNLAVEYAPPLLSDGERADLNAGVRQVREDAAAVRFMRRFYEPRGRTRAKVLTIHALDDGLVVPENEEKYRQAFEAAGRGEQLVQLYTAEGGHCGFVAELLPGLQALVDWVERDARPSTATLRTACPFCTFTDAVPGPFGVRVPERRQRGAPLRSLVCDGATGDCPADATCSTARRRCRPG